MYILTEALPLKLVQGFDINTSGYLAFAKTRI